MESSESPVLRFETAALQKQLLRAIHEHTVADPFRLVSLASVTHELRLDARESEEGARALLARGLIQLIPLPRGRRVLLTQKGLDAFEDSHGGADRRGRRPLRARLHLQVG